jgi:ketosteroid isomerase-like protein
VSPGSPEIETIRRVYDTWNSGDIAAFARLLHPSISWRTFDFDGQERTLIGRDEVQRFHESIVERTGWFSFEPAALIQVGNRVVASLISTTPGVEAGPSELPLAAVWTVHEGSPVAVRLFYDKDRALAAAQR